MPKKLRDIVARSDASRSDRTNRMKASPSQSGWRKSAESSNNYESWLHNNHRSRYQLGVRTYDNKTWHGVVGTSIIGQFATKKAAQSAVEKKADSYAKQYEAEIRARRAARSAEPEAKKPTKDSSGKPVHIYDVYHTKGRYDEDEDEGYDTNALVKAHTPAHAKRIMMNYMGSGKVHNVDHVTPDYLNHEHCLVDKEEHDHFHKHGKLGDVHVYDEGT